VKGVGIFLHITKGKTKIGQTVKLVFLIGQNERDQKLLELNIKYLGYGKIYKKKQKGKYLN
jgi:hypothetical protein